MRINMGGLATFEINRESAKHKFGGDPMAEYVHHLSLDSSNADEEVGTVDDVGWHARFGKRILSEDSNGFVYLHRYDSVAEAEADMAAIAAQLGIEFEDDDEV